LVYQKFINVRSINYYKIFQRTYQKLLEEKNSEIIAKKYTVGGKKQRIISEQKRKFQKFWMIFFQNKVKEIINIKKLLIKIFII
jgi:hypothetical protein